MATTFLESGSAATQDLNMFNVAAITGGGGTIASNSQAVAGSVRSVLSSTGASNGFAVIGNFGVLADAGRRISFYFRYSGTISPTGGGGADFCAVNTVADAAIFGVSLTAAGKIVITDNGTNALVTGTAALSASTDYRILVVYTITSTTVNSIVVKVFDSSNTLLDTITATNVTLPNTASDTIFFGWGTYNAAGANLSGFYAHIYIDDQTSGDPGNIKVTAKRPIANGTTNGYTTQIGSGGSGTGTGHSPQVNERPLSITNGWSMIGAGSAITEEYNIESTSAGDVDISAGTIVDYVGWVYSKSLANETAKIIVNNVQSNTNLTSTAKMFTKIAGSATYPAGTGTDIGQITTTALTTVSLYECGIIVAYTPGAGAASSPKPGYMLMSGFFG